MVLRTAQTTSDIQRNKLFLPVSEVMNFKTNALLMSEISGSQDSEYCDGYLCGFAPCSMVEFIGVTTSISETSRKSTRSAEQ